MTLTFKQTARRVGDFFAALVRARALSAPRLDDALRDKR
jgi:hypothetical protein